MVAVDKYTFERIDSCIVEEVPSLAIDWKEGTVFNVNSPFDVTVKATNKGTQPIERVLYIVEVIENGGNAGIKKVLAKAGDSVGQVLGYDETGDFWYWGDRNDGFTFGYEDTVETTFEVQALPGNYEVNIYAVQLPEPQV
ncbi:MAG: hypothetical protein ACOX8W_08670 [bacterium]